MADIWFVAPLFVPGDRPDRFEKAAASGADAIIVDLEDSVAEDQKTVARDNVAQLGDFPVPVAVRINAAGSRHFTDDLSAVAEARPAAVMLAKYESADDARRARESLGHVVSLMPLVETAFGSVDYAADVGCAHEDSALAYARSAIVLASRAARIAQPLDGVTTSFDQPGLAGDAARAARRFGFGGKLCVHPLQVKEVRDAFAPSEAEIAWAKRILAAGGDGAATAVGGEMIDAAVLARARRLLAGADVQ
jgi:citrate lyase subunit beta/citryl-CoA lyase